MAFSLIGVCKRGVQSLGITAIRSRTHVRLLQTSRWNMGAFEEAKDNIKLLKEDPGNLVKLQLYALFKQGSSGKVTGSRPGMMDFVGRAKWDAWNQLGDMSQGDAKNKYIETVEGLMKSQGVAPGGSASAGAAAAPAAAAPASVGEGLLVTREDNMTIIKLNRPAKKNAITTQMYNDISSALEEAGKDDSALAVVTGAGDFYCSGNDLSNFMGIDPSNMKAHAVDGAVVLKRFVGSFIDFPKPLIAVVNGPAVGVSVTVLGLFDGVYATDRATFHTPFSLLGQSPEGCSSFIFPKLMGHAKAQEMLLFNRKLTAKEACERGLVTEVLPDHAFQETIWPRVKQLAQLPPQSLRLSKNLARDAERALLHQVNERECQLLIERWQSEECINAIMSFFSSKL